MALVAGSTGGCAGDDDSNADVPAENDGGLPAADADPNPSEASPPPVDSSSPDGTSPTTCAGKTGAAGTRTVKIMSGGIERSFDLHVPANYDPTKRTPLVLVFHGYTMSASSIATATHFSETADKRGMIVAYPDGTGGGFNAGDCCGTASSNKVDDLGFTRDLLGKLEAEYCVDEKRVFSTGFSNGGFFSYRLACELADKIAAIAPVSGVFGVDPATCKPKRPVPVLHIHGTGDAVVPYLGGGVALSRSVATSVAAFRTNNACATDGKVVFTKGDVECTSWAPCTAGADVELCEVAAGGHQWPGGDLLPYGGVPSTNLIASDAIADFFAAHPMP
jgi:polyhydroxybutyrate depolymerase